MHAPLETRHASSRLLRAALILGALLLPTLALGQNGYPNAERRIGISAGDTIMLLNRVMHDNSPALRPPGRRLDLQYSTLIPRADSAARMAQADRAAEFFGAEAVQLGVRRLSIG